MLGKLLRKYKSTRNLTFLPLPEELLDNNYHSILEKISIAEAISDFEKHRARKLDLYPHNFTETLIEFCGSVLNRSSYRNAGILQSINRGSAFLTFGSCFAAEIHRYLLGYGIESHTITLADHVNSPRMSRDGLKLEYRPIDCYHWRLENPADQAIVSRYQDERVSNDYLASCDVEREQEIMRLEHVYRSERFVDQFGYLKSMLPKTDVVIFTLGTAIMRHNSKSQFESVDDTVAFIAEIREIIYRLNPSATVFFSLSPVPLQGFSGINKSCLTAVEADSISKSISRVAIYKYFDAIDSSFEQNTFYFPSYEIVRWIAPYYAQEIWQDPHHLKRSLVKLICRLFIATFMAR